jgi:hypothetical protein
MYVGAMVVGLLIFAAMVAGGIVGGMVRNRQSAADRRIGLERAMDSEPPDPHHGFPA